VEHKDSKLVTEIEKHKGLIMTDGWTSAIRVGKLSVPAKPKGRHISDQCSKLHKDVAHSLCLATTCHMAKGDPCLRMEATARMSQKPSERPNKPRAKCEANISQRVA
jgi:hypothetical protein